MPATTLHPKVVGSTGAGLIAAIIIWVASYWVTVPDEVKVGLPILLGLIGGWLAPWLPKPPATNPLGLVGAPVHASVVADTPGPRDAAFAALLHAYTKLVENVTSGQKAIENPTQEGT